MLTLKRRELRLLNAPAPPAPEALCYEAHGIGTKTRTCRRRSPTSAWPGGWSVDYPTEAAINKLNSLDSLDSLITFSTFPNTPYITF